MSKPENIVETRKLRAKKNESEIWEELTHHGLLLINPEINRAIVKKTLRGLKKFEQSLKEKILQRFKPEDGHILIMGVPGAGKTTQGKHLAEILEIPFISTGEMLREEVEKETALGLEAKSYMDKGELAPDELVIKMVEKRLDGEKMCIVDGFPRNKTQVDNNPDFARRAIALNLRDEVAVERLSVRKDENGDTRDDDKPEVIRDRVAKYHKTTEPIIQLYREKDALTEVDQEKDDKDWMVFANLIAKMIAEEAELM